MNNNNDSNSNIPTTAVGLSTFNFQRAAPPNLTNNSPFVEAQHFPPLEEIFSDSEPYIGPVTLKIVSGHIKVAHTVWQPMKTWRTEFLIWNILMNIFLYQESYFYQKGKYHYHILEKHFLKSIVTFSINQLEVIFIKK